GDAVAADALWLAPAPHAFPEASELVGIALRHLLHVGRVPPHVAVTLVGITHEAVRERQPLRPFARHRPLRFRAQALAERGAFELRLVEAIHHLGPLPLLVREGVAIDAEALRHLLADAANGGLELLAHRLLVGLVVPAALALVLDLRAIGAIDELHVRRTGGRRRGRLRLRRRCARRLLAGRSGRGSLRRLGHGGRRLGAPGGRDRWPATARALALGVGLCFLARRCFRRLRRRAPGGYRARGKEEGEPESEAYHPIRITTVRGRPPSGSQDASERSLRGR